MRPGMMSPIRQKMAQRMPAPGSNMPAINPEMMDEDGVFAPPMQEEGTPLGRLDQANRGLDGAIDSAEIALGARATPVHDMGQAQQFYQGMGKEMPQGMRDFTGAMQNAPAGPLREKMHAKQHQMMVGDQKSVIQSKRMELSAKKQQLEAVYSKIHRGEIMDTDGKIRKQLDTGIGQINGLLQSLGQSTDQPY